MMMFFGIVRLTAVAIGNQDLASDTGTASVVLDCGRGDFCFFDGSNITGGGECITAIFLPTENAIEKFCEIATGEEKKEGIENLNNNIPVTLKTETEIICSGVFCYETEERYSQLFGLEHIIGYLDDENRGVVGLEKGYDSLLYSSAYKKVSFSVDAKGNYLPGVTPVISGGSSGTKIYLTVDRDIQKICLEVASEIQKGGIVVTEVATGKIKGIISKPLYSAKNLKYYINSKDSPLINRVLNAYSVGSVFKPLVAGAMLENGVGDFCYTCLGSEDISGITFNCNKTAGHGNLTLKDGLVASCNTYFYSGALRVNPESLLNTANALGFGAGIDICNGIYGEMGNITSLKNLSSKAGMANFAIGQGDILISPLAITNLYSAIAGGGSYFSPTLIEKIEINGEVKEISKTAQNFVFSGSTANILKEYLTEVVEKGTGKLAKSSIVKIGGKTATAQTGQYNGEKEILNAWFCGFFPADNPKYAATVFVEDGSSGGSDAAPIFKSLAEKISELERCELSVK